MANNQTDVELRIRATNYSKKTTTEVTDALKDLVKAEEAQIEASKKGAASAADLEKGYSKIESAVKALLGQQSLIKLFQSQSAALDEVKAKLEAARKAQADYAKYVADSGKQTPAQTKALKEQAATVADLEKQMGRLEAKVGTSASNLRQFGVDASNAAQKQQQIVTAVTAANAALDRQEAAMDAADGYAKQARDAAKAAAAAEQKARADKAASDATAKATAALEAQVRAEQEVAAAEAMRNVQHEADMEVLFTQVANKRTEALERQAVALRAAADAAERQMRSAATNARGTAPVSTPTVSAQLADIAQPSQAALRNVDALTASITDLTNKVNAINGPVKNYRDVLQQAQQAQRALADMGGLLDSYNRQIAAVRTARTEYVAARADVTALITAMRSGAAGDDVTTRLARAQNTLERAAANMSNLTNAARQTQAALRAAGVDTTNLAAAESNLINQANRGAQAMNTLTDAYRRNGAAAENAGSSIFRWFGGDGGRTTLSFAQRLRGEVLGLATAFIGVNAAIGLAKKTLDVYNQNQAIMSRLTIVAGGDTHKAADEFKYLQDQADRIGFVFTEVAPAYAKFAIAMKAAGFQTDAVRFSFEQIAGAAVKAHLSTDELTGVLKAFEQMASKGKIQAEELRGQLGDRLPGAFQIAAKAAGVTVQEYTKMMELGQIGSEQVIAIARELGKTYGAASAGAETLLVAQARFENATNRFLTQVGEGGFVQAYQNLLNRLTQFLNDGSADKIAQALSNGFVIVIDVLQKVVENLDLVKVAIEGILAIKFISWLASLPGLFRAFSAELVIVNGALLTMQARLNAASGAVALSAALGPTGLTGVAVRLAPALIAVGNALLFVARAIPVIGAAVLAYQATTAILDAMDDKVRAKVTKAQIDQERSAAQLEQAADALNKARGTKEEQAAQDRYNKLREIAVKAIKDRSAAEAEAREKGVRMQAVAEAQAKRDADAKTAATGTPDPGNPDGSGNALIALQQELAKQQKVIDRQAQNERLRAAKGDLAARLDLIDQEFDAQRDNAKKTITDKTKLEEALQLINKTSLSKQGVERQKYNNEQAKKDKMDGEQRVKLARQVTNDIRDLQASLNERAAEQAGTSLPIEDQIKAAKATVDKTFTDISEKIARLNKFDPKAAQAAQAQVEALRQQAQGIAQTNVYREQANALTDEFTKKQKIMQTNIASIQSQVDSGQMSIIAGNDAINAQIKQYGPGVQEAGAAALDFATKFQAMLDPVKYAEIVATVKAGTAKAGVDAQTAANNVLTTQKLLNNLLAAEQREREQIELERSLNLKTSEEETAALNETAAKYQGTILQLTQQLQGFIATAREANAMSAEQLDEIAASTEKISTSTKFAQKSLTDLQTTIKDSIVNNGVTAFDAIGQSLAKVALGQQSISQGFRDMGQAALVFFAQLLRDITMAILKQQILNALQGFFGGGAAPGASNVAPIPVAHAGGPVGTQSRKRAVNPGIFAQAQRFHDGGLPGLKADEVPTILQKGEEVLTKNDARNVLNGGGAAPGNGDGSGVRFVLVDDRARVPEAMAGSDGSRVVVQHIKANIPTIKTMLGIR